MVLSALVPYAFLLQTLIGIYIYIYLRYEHPVLCSVLATMQKESCNHNYEKEGVYLDKNSYSYLSIINI